MYLFIFFQFLGALEFPSKILSNKLSRDREYQADRFAVKNGHGKEIQKAIVNLAKLAD